jgi:uncharacterized membrane protein YraQ (UPF0718 family)
MDAVLSYCLYGITGVMLIISLIKSKTKTAQALKKARKMFLAVLPQFIAILLLSGLLFGVIRQETLQTIIGSESGLKGMLLSAALGSAAIIPVLIAFPITSELLQNGAGLMQIAVFITTLTTVGFVTMPLEMKYFGRKITLLRNLLAFIFSFVTAVIVGVVLQ